MIRRSPLFALLSIATLSARAADLPRPAAQPFEPGEVKLLEGPYLNAVQLDSKFLLSLDPDRLLAWYRKEAGLKPKAANYGGWEGQGIAGHSLGHYLSACSRMYRETGDQQFRQRVDHVVEELAACQQAVGDGFLGAMPNGRKVFDEVSHGDIRSQGFDLNDSWVPWYNLHKLFAGLIDAYRIAGNEQAKTVVARLSDWAIAVTKNLTPDQWQTMLACEHGGMNEALADVADITGNPAYLELAQKFYHKAILDPLADGRDELGGKHANTQIPKAIGAARIFELTGDEKFAKISKFFWDTVVANHTYVTGGNSDAEHFAAPGKLNDHLGVSTTETCNTYNMLKLTTLLFKRDPRPEYAEYMERALWNHILASRNPQSGQVCYYLTLRPGETRHYVGDLDFTCCNGSGMENPPRTADYIYFHGPGELRELWANQFIPSEVDWKTAGVRLRQETQFPNKQRTSFTISCEKPTKFTLHLRHPKWISGPLAVTLNGEKLAVTSTSGGYADIDREWRDGDKLEVDLPLRFHTESMPDNPRRIAVFDGPILLAGDLSGVKDEPRVPVLIYADRPVNDWVTPVTVAADSPAAATMLNFETKGVGRPQDVPLLPFYMAHDMPATVYWETSDDAGWRRRQAEYEAQRRLEQELAARTVDRVATGEMQSERDHGVEGEKSGFGEFNGRKFRHAWDGGWFSWKLTVPKQGDAELVVDYWGGETVSRDFDVLVDGKTIDTTHLQMNDPDKFWQKSYPLPAELIADKSQITVRFQAKPGNYAGGVFGIRILTPK